MRPTGRLHIGHYFGALQNWVRLQNEVLPSGKAASSSSPLATRHSPALSEAEGPLPAYECFYFVADWHALTSDYADTTNIAENSLQITIDFLASGLDPAKSTMFLQSQVPEHAELHLLLSMVTPLGWLERVPTYKEAFENIKDKDLHTYGFLGYPTLQTADIVMYSAAGKGLFVPVGEDQVSHVEFSRELVRRFNTFYGLNIDLVALDRDKRTADYINHLLPKLGAEDFERIDEVWRRNIRDAAIKWGIENFFDKLGDRAKPFISFAKILEEPKSLLTPTPRIPGLDGRKMSKSY